MPIGDADSTVAGAIIGAVKNGRVAINFAAVRMEPRARSETQVSKCTIGDGQDLKLRCLGVLSRNSPDCQNAKNFLNP